GGRAVSPLAPRGAFSPSSLPNVVVIADPNHVEQGNTALFGFDPEQDVLRRLAKPQPAVKRIDTDRLTPAIRDIVLFLVVFPDFLRPLCVRLGPGRCCHSPTPFPDTPPAYPIQLPIPSLPPN